MAGSLVFMLEKRVGMLEDAVPEPVEGIGGRSMPSSPTPIAPAL